MRLHSGLRLPDELKIRDASSSSEELVMAMRIIAFMSVLFKPERHRLQDIFKQQLAAAPATSSPETRLKATVFIILGLMLAGVAAIAYLGFTLFFRLIAALQGAGGT